MSPMSPGSHFISVSCTSSRSMCYVFQLSLGSHQASTPFIFSYYGRSRSHVSHRSHCMNHVKIYPFPDVLCPQWALGATSYEYHIHLAARCTMCPHWALGATRFQHPLHLAISDVPGPHVSHRSHYMNPAKIYPFSDVSCPQWALGATSYQCHIHIAVRCTMCPHWAQGATRLQRALHLAISDVPGLLWAIGAAIWTTSRSIHFQTFYVPNEPWEPLHTNVIKI